jgi:hypothetical protein
MLNPLRPLDDAPAFDRVAPRYAFVFEPTTRNLEAAVAFAGDPDRVLVGLDATCARGTTPATLLPLLWLLSVESDAHLLVVLPATEQREAVFLGEALHLAALVRQHAPEWWAALADGACLERYTFPDLPASDLARDVLARTLGPATHLPGHRAVLHEVG